MSHWLSGTTSTRDAVALALLMLLNSTWRVCIVPYIVTSGMMRKPARNEREIGAAVAEASSIKYCRWHTRWPFCNSLKGRSLYSLLVVIGDPKWYNFLMLPWLGDDDEEARMPFSHSNWVEEAAASALTLFTTEEDRSRRNMCVGWVENEMRFSALFGGWWWIRW